MILTSKTALRSYLVISDVHLGARSTTADEILAHLTTFFYDFSDTSEFAQIDTLFIAGDLWDDTVQLASDVVPQVIFWFNRVVRWCARNRIQLRILEGTPRHDRRQGVSLKSIVDVLEIDIDFKYIIQLSIEKNERLGLSILYVPDECRPTAEICRTDVEALLTEHQLQKVDIAIMHGAFKYQLGLMPMTPKVHDEVWYLEHVKHYISIGHVHTPSQFNRIVAQGSFDRLSHGEEEAKGGVLIKEIKPSEWMHFFIENREAKRYLTIDVEGPLENALTKIDRMVRPLPFGSYVRIRGLSNHPLFQGFETLRARYPLFIFSKKTMSQEDIDKPTEPTKALDYKPIVLNKQTLTDAILTEVTQRRPLTPLEEERLHTHLEALHF